MRAKTKDNVRYVPSSRCTASIATSAQCSDARHQATQLVRPTLAGATDTVGTTDTAGATDTAGGSSSDKMRSGHQGLDQPFFVAMQAGARGGRRPASTSPSCQAGGRRRPGRSMRSRMRRSARGHPDHTNVDVRQRCHSEGPRRRPVRHALDTPMDPPDAVDITFATDNRRPATGSGNTAKKLDGRRPIALLDIFDDKIVSVDYNRDQGFLRAWASTSTR